MILFGTDSSSIYHVIAQTFYIYKLSLGASITLLSSVLRKIAVTNIFEKFQN